MGGSGRTDPSAASSPLLSVDEVATYLGVGPVTVYRWCRQGRLPALKLGKAWRIRRGALEDFLRQGDQDRSLAGLLTPFLRVPDHVIAVGATAGLVRRLDAAFFQVAEAHDGLMVKSYRGETASVDTLRRVLRDEGVDVTALEAAGRFAFTAEGDPRRDRATALRDLLQRPQAQGRSVWVSFDWVQEIDLATALGEQEALAARVSSGHLVVMTAMVEAVFDRWPAADQRRVQRLHRGIIWIDEHRMTLSRVHPLPSS